MAFPSTIQMYWLYRYTRHFSDTSEELIIIQERGKFHWFILKGDNFLSGPFCLKSIFVSEAWGRVWVLVNVSIASSWNTSPAISPLNPAYILSLFALLSWLAPRLALKGSCSGWLNAKERALGEDWNFSHERFGCN